MKITISLDCRTFSSLHYCNSQITLSNYNYNALKLVSKLVSKLVVDFLSYNFSFIFHWNIFNMFFMSWNDKNFLIINVLLENEAKAFSLKAFTWLWCSYDDAFVIIFWWRLQYCYFAIYLIYYIYLTAKYLQIAKITVNHVDIVWQTTVKWAWNSVKTAQPNENLSSKTTNLMYWWIEYGVYDIITKQSATARPVKIKFVGEIISFLE